ncbi:tRNA pseudouridine(13) synthase TruD [Larsenimonas rhizosphaerae]|uniref:tRNA pseudouridine(13) synthase TruD n=1 Tax=Larsenimonas rhizosphaerae TaxID=2944682 RepID=UPI00203468A6|nr:tRNA pseudouridine(13) synthase TruD [Larsenimonas rhizosphaerae]
MSGILPEWPRAFGLPVGPARYRQHPDHFQVEEQLGFEPEGDGEHWWLFIEKANLGTLEMARRLGQLLDVELKDIGYSGLKDRMALTRQWFSIWLPGRPLPTDPATLVESAGGRLLNAGRHRRKLKRGAHRANRFYLRLEGECVMTDAFDARWEQLLDDGVPNYFGPQRFGVGGENLRRARQVMDRGWRRRDDRQGMLLSSARSFLFNEVLAERIDLGCWNQALEGDVFMLEGSHSHFASDGLDERLRQRVATLDIHPTGPLYGTGRSGTSQTAETLERDVLHRHESLAGGIERARAEAGRRALRVRVEAGRLLRDETGTWLGMTLPRGAFATAVLRELIDHPTL